MQYSFLNCFSQIMPALGIGNPFSLLLCFFDKPPSWCWFYFFPNTILLFGTRIYSRSVLYISCPRPRMSQFSKKRWMVLEAQVWVLVVITGMSENPYSWYNKVIYMCILTKYIYISITISLYILICIYIKVKCVHTQTLIHYHMNYSCLLFLFICNLLLQQWEN